MRLLLDTHVLFWWLKYDPHLSPAARRAISQDMSEVYVSSASVWEIAIKVRSGKWPEAVDILAEIESRLESERFWPLPVTIAHAKRSGEFTSPHRDPFDRLLAAQADIEDLTLVTADRQFAGFPVKTIW